jgi:drug/metabolite transporter (DMT)-like permease
MALLLDIVFGAIGSGYMLYAKRQFDALFAVVGFALIVFPYFVSNAWATLAIGAALCAAPFAIRRL